MERRICKPEKEKERVREIGEKETRSQGRSLQKDANVEEREVGEMGRRSRRDGKEPEDEGHTVPFSLSTSHPVSSLQPPMNLHLITNNHYLSRKPLPQY